MKRVSGVAQGYTILETMIFLAVSGVLFFVAMRFVGGQQRKTELSTAIRELDAKIQTVMSNVATGYYSNSGHTTCTVSGGVITSIVVGGVAQGQNNDCTFIGQYISLNPARDTFVITGVAGVRRVTSAVPPREVANLTEAGPYRIPNPENYRLLSGLTGRITLASSGTILDTLGVMTTFNQYNGNVLKSGSTRADLYAYTAAPPSPYTFNPAGGISICITNGQQRGVILLNTGSTNTTIQTGVC